jgi:hypothetical protein
MEKPMSGVFQRNRKVSEEEYFFNARKIRLELNKILTTSKFVPKSFRATTAPMMANSARDLVNNIIFARETTDKNFFINSVNNAIANCYQLLEDVDCLIQTNECEKATPGNLESVITKLTAEIDLLKEYKKGGNHKQFGHE